MQHCVRRGWKFGAAALLMGLFIAPAAGAFTYTSLGTLGGDPPAPQYAVGISAADAGESFRIGWSLDRPSVSAAAVFTVSSYADDAIVLDITLENLTNLVASGLSTASILSMGFGVTPDAVATLTTAGAVFDSVGEPVNGRYPGGFRGIDVCVFAQGCTGGASWRGLLPGESDSFTITLTPESQDFSQGTSLAFFPLKFQTSLGSFELPGSPFDGPPPGNPVPEPSAGLAFAAGSLVVAFSTRRRRSV